MICALEHIPLEHLFSFFVLFHHIFGSFFYTVSSYKFMANFLGILPIPIHILQYCGRHCILFWTTSTPYLDILDMSRNGCSLALKIFEATDILGLICLGVYNASWSGIDQISFLA